MIKQLLDEVRSAPLDDAARARLAEIHERSLHELEEGLSPELVAELHRITLPFVEDQAPSDAELRIAQAQLVGWLEGLFHGIQTALVAQQVAAQGQLAGMRRQLPAGPVAPAVHPSRSRAPTAPTRRPGSTCSSTPGGGASSVGASSRSRPVSTMAPETSSSPTTSSPCGTCWSTTAPTTAAVAGSIASSTANVAARTRRSTTCSSAYGTTDEHTAIATTSAASRASCSTGAAPPARNGANSTAPAAIATDSPVIPPFAARATRRPSRM